MNNQQAFQKSALHILQQQRICSITIVGDTGEEDSVCVYAGPDGQSCAGGCLLPRRIAEQLDKAKLSSWASVKQSRSSAAKAAKKALEGVDFRLLETLQEIHDQSREVSLKASGRSAADKRALRRELRELGTEMGLKVEFLSAKPT
jgi:hypothetical protein